MSDDSDQNLDGIVERNRYDKRLEQHVYDGYRYVYNGESTDGSTM